MNWVTLVLGISANAAASIFIKIAMSSSPPVLDWDGILGVVRNPVLWLGLFFYGVALCLFSLALRDMPLSIVQPVLTAGAIIVVTLFSLLYFHEHFSISMGIGIVFILVGVFLVTAKV